MITHLDDTIKEVQKLATQNGYKTSFTDDRICPQVNGLTASCLHELGHEKIASDTMEHLSDSKAYNNETQLFHRKLSPDNEVLEAQYNTCKNAAAILGLYNNNREEAKEITDALMKHEKLWNDRLLFRGYNPRTADTDTQIITHSNLWASLALHTVGRKAEAANIINELQKQKKEDILLQSHDYRDPDAPPRHYTDDQALAAIMHHRLGNDMRAEQIVERMLESPSYDESDGLWYSHFHSNEKSTYKNALMGRALLQTGFEIHAGKLKRSIHKLYNPERKLFKRSTQQESYEIDSSLLALTLLRYEETAPNS